MRLSVDFLKCNVYCDDQFFLSPRKRFYVLPMFGIIITMEACMFALIRGLTINIDIFERLQNVREGGGGLQPMYSLFFPNKCLFVFLKAKEMKK